MNAASSNNVKMIEILLSYGANPRLRDKFGDDAATYAREQGHEQLANYLAGK
jgi:ankyrin repeat protein